MAAVDERVDRLEEAMIRFVDQTSMAIAAIHEDVAEIRASAARTDRELLGMRQESDRRWKETNQRFEKLFQQAEKDRQDWQARADEDRQDWQTRADKDRQDWQIRADNDRADWESQGESARQQTEKDRQDWQTRADNDRADWEARADKDRADWQARTEKDRVDWEVRADKAEKERKEENKAFNRRLAEISDRVGRFIEDMVYPNAERIALKLFAGDAVETLTIRVKRKHPADPSRRIELDLLVVGARHLLVGEAKSTPTVEKADAFLEKIRELPEFFPEYAGRKILPMLASVTIDPPLVKYLSRKHIYALGFGDETMELLNDGDF
ncbi:MAG TPA: hypothetical protein VIT91_10245 [Chthoniobacterales bacterium]